MVTLLRLWHVSCFSYGCSQLPFTQAITGVQAMRALLTQVAVPVALLIFTWGLAIYTIAYLGR